jgi:putative ABC transport system ATP-binding protein
MAVKQETILEARNKPAVVLSNVEKVYGSEEIEIHALKGISLEIQQGEIVTIMGPSGSGKTTLLNLLGAMDFPTSGEILVDGWNISYMKESKLSEFRKKSIGYIFQDFYLIPNLDVINNVLVPLIPYGIKEEDRKFAQQILQQVGLGDRAKQKVQKLSGGQKQRVAIARALINKPNIILADEPTGNLDSETGRGIIDLLIELSKQGKTVVIVTHDPRISSLIRQQPNGRNIWMLDGKISDTPSVNQDCW